MRRLRTLLQSSLGGLPGTFWWLWGGALLSALATFVFPFLALYLTARGFTAQRIGLLVSLLGVGAIAAGPLAGTIADRLGRRPAVLTALVGSALAAAWLGAVQSPGLIAPGVLVFGLCTSMAYPAINATVADLVPEGRVAQAYGLLYWASNLGIGFSALIGGALASKSWLGLFISDALTTLAFAAVIYRRIPESRPAPRDQGAAPARGWTAVLRDSALGGFLLAQIGFGLIFWQFQFAVPIAMARHGFGAAQFGQVMAVNCLFIIAVQAVVTRALSRFPAHWVLAGSAFLLGAGYGAYSFCTTALHYLLATVVWSAGEVTGLPVASALVAQLAPEDLRGRYQGAFSLSFSIAMTAAPILGGTIIDRFGTRTLWACCFAMGLLVAVLQLALGVARKRTTRERA